MPYYVTEIRAAENILVVSPDPREAARGTVRLERFHALADREELVGALQCQSRYREPPVACTAHARGDELTLAFEEPHLVSPGQSAVLYRGSRCLGGGIAA